MSTIRSNTALVVIPKLYVLIRTHNEYDYEDVEIVGITDQVWVAWAFQQIGMYDGYWAHDVKIATLNTLADHTDVHLRINDYLDPATNPLCECGHRFLHHRNSKHTGSCKHNMPQHHIVEQHHKCKKFVLASKQPELVYANEEVLEAK